ncbi:hypothetical protein [Paenibacillus sp. CR_12]|uniref:hypothetical protein n=1 Tax=Paenibacillus sp. CR_12 TaxID=3055793 RepID=UPI0035C0BC53
MSVRTFNGPHIWKITDLLSVTVRGPLIWKITDLLSVSYGVGVRRVFFLSPVAAASI